MAELSSENDGKSAVARAERSEILEVKKALEERKKDKPPVPPQPTKGLTDKWRKQKREDGKDSGQQD